MQVRNSAIICQQDASTIRCLIVLPMNADLLGWYYEQMEKQQQFFHILGFSLTQEMSNPKTVNLEHLVSWCPSRVLAGS